MEMNKFTVVREMLRNNYRSCNLIVLGNKPKNFDFIHQTVSRKEAHTGASSCVNSVFSMQPQCLHSLQSVVSLPSGFSKEWLIQLAILLHNIHISRLQHFLSYGHPWSHDARIREVLLYCTSNKC